MASYPTSVKTFTTKNAGDTIQPSHVGDLQDEVTAIEDGLLNGSAPVNSSRITAPASQITNSTVTALSVGGGSTFAVRPITPPPDCAVVYLDSTVTIGSSNTSTVVWNAQAVLTNSSMHSTASNPSRLTPQSTGLYKVTAQVGFALNSTGNRAVVISDSSGATLGLSRVRAVDAENMFVQATAYKRFDALGGYVTCSIDLSGASTMSLLAGSGISWFALEKR